MGNLKNRIARLEEAMAQPEELTVIWVDAECKDEPAPGVLHVRWRTEAEELAARGRGEDD